LFIDRDSRETAVTASSWFSYACRPGDRPRGTATRPLWAAEDWSAPL